MHEDLHAVVQHLKESDHQSRLNYCNWLLQRSIEDPHFWQKVIITDESHFQ